MLIDIDPAHLSLGLGILPGPEDPTRNQPEKPGSGMNRPDQITLSGLVAEEARVLDPTRPKPEIRWVPKLIM